MCQYFQSGHCFPNFSWNIFPARFWFFLIRHFKVLLHFAADLENCAYKILEMKTNEKHAHIKSYHTCKVDVEVVSYVAETH